MIAEVYDIIYTWNKFKLPYNLLNLLLESSMALKLGSTEQVWGDSSTPLKVESRRSEFSPNSVI